MIKGKGNKLKTKKGNGLYTYETTKKDVFPKGDSHCMDAPRLKNIELGVMLGYVRIKVNIKYLVHPHNLFT